MRNQIDLDAPAFIDFPFGPTIGDMLAAAVHKARGTSITQLEHTDIEPCGACEFPEADRT